jgi:gliding motility-associated-like protein
MSNLFNKILIVSKSKFKGFIKTNRMKATLAIVFTGASLTLQSQDIDINQIISPVPCISNPGSYTVTVELINNGSSDLNSIPVGLAFSTNGGTSFSTPEFFIATSLSNNGDTETYTFSQPVNLTAAQDYNFVVRINTPISGDPDLVDQLATTLRVMTNFTLPSLNICANTDIGVLDASNPAANSWQWDFGDGNTSNFQFNSQVYSDTGTYTITLQSSGGGCSGALSRTVTVRPPVADFVLNPSTGCSLPHTVFFTDQSTLPDTWFWDFGDGNTSTLQNPVHNYTTAGDYTVSLVVTDTIYGCSGSQEALVSVAIPNPEFTESSGSIGGVSGCGPLTVNFQDASTLQGSTGVVITGWSWDFGDGNTSNAQNPTHTYTSATNASFDVSLTVTLSNGCTDVITKPNFVQIAGPEPDFMVTNASGCAPLTSVFTDNSTLTFTALSYLWDFGDGNTSSTIGDVSHTYTTSDTFDVTLTIEDVDGCVRSRTYNNMVNTQDTIPPTISCPSDLTLNNNFGQCGGTISFSPPSGFDNCGVASIMQTTGLPSGSLYPIGTTTNTYVVTDNAGLTGTCSHNITVIDAEFPTITCPSDIVQTNDLGACGAIVNYIAPVGLDNCPSPTTVQTSGLASGSLFPIGTTTNTFEVTDASGNVTVCSFDVVITDTELPTISCIADISQNSDLGACGAIITFAAPTGLDNCPSPTTVQTAGLASGSLFPVGVTTNTFVVTDASGNIDSCSFDVIISDSELPTISCPSNVIQNNDFGQCSAAVSYTLPVGIDNCPGAVTTLTAGLASNATFPVGTTTNTYLVTDAANNTATCSFDVTVIDAEAPSVSCPANITQNNDAGDCGAIVNYTEPIGTDNCALSAGSTFLASGISPGNIFPVGTTTNTYTVQDLEGNSTSCSFTVTVIDAELPTISCPSNISQANDIGACGAVVNYSEPIGTDNCLGDVTIQTAGLPDGSVFPVGTTTNTFQVTDAAGNVTTCSFDVTVFDAESPVITCIGDIAQNNDLGQCGAVVTFTAPVGLDNCPGASTVQIGGLASGSLFPVGVTNNLFEVTDANGNTDTCSFNVIITDTEFPTITCPADIAQNNDIGACGAVINYTAPTGLDNCPGSTTVQIAGLASGALFPIGTTINTFEVTDASGNVSTCSFNVIISDTEFPTLICPSDVAQDNDLGMCGAVVTYTTPIGIDNCSGATTIQTAGLASGSSFPVGTTTNTFEVTDASGNTTTCSFDVVINDAELPTITCLADIAQNNDPGQCSAVVTYVAPVGADNCPGATTIQTGGLSSGSVFPVGTTTNTYEVTDAAGNTVTCSFDVVITDAEIPTITCSADIAQNNDIGQCGAIVTYTAPVGLDNCLGAVTAQTAGLASGSLFPVGTTTNIFEVTDAAGNTVSCSFDVVISDTEFPTISCPLDIAQDNDIGECGAIVTYTAPIGLDNCTGSVTIQTAGLPSGDLFPVGTTTNTFEVTDASGNSITCSFDVVITDTELPTILCPNDTIINNDLGICGAIFTFTSPVGLDNCTGPITTQTAGLVSAVEYPIGTTTNTYEVVDMAGNSATCSFDVEVIDAELPTITCSESFESCDSILTVNEPEINDNCPNPVFELTSGLPSESIFPVGTTVNLYTVTDANGNQATCQVEITRFALPVIDAGPDLTIDAGKSVVIDATGTNVNIFEWSPIDGIDNSGIEDPEANPMFSTEYIVRVISDDECEAVDTLYITVNLVIEANNFMSPNGDGKNDTWIVKGNYLLDECTIKIYSPWGNLVYESEGYDNSWDGTFRGSELPAGNYYYVISCGSDKPTTGSITLIR